MFAHLNGLLAQLVEQGTLNAWVGGSSPSQPTSSRGARWVIADKPLRALASLVGDEFLTSSL